MEKAGFLTTLLKFYVYYKYTLEAESIFIQAGVCHNNICQKSVYVCHDGSWRLGGLEHACKFTEATPAFLQSCSTFRYQEGLAPEEKVKLCFRIDTLW